MTVMIQIRNVPDEIHRTMKARAAKAGMSLSEYLLREIGELAGRPTMEEWLERVKSRQAVELPVSAADLLREAREEREGL